MRPPISWSALADASVGLWGLGVEGRASLHRLRRMGGEPVLVDDTPRAPELDGLEVLATDQGGLSACCAARWWSRARVSAATAPKWRSWTRPAWPCAADSASGWSRPTRTASSASPAPRGRARPRPWPSTCCAPWATRPGPGATSATRPGTRRPTANPTTGWSRPRASRSPTSTSARGWWPSRRSSPTTSTGTDRSSGTTPTSSPWPRSPVSSSCW